jgi:hypothetical protein
MTHFIYVGPYLECTVPEQRLPSFLHEGECASVFYENIGLATGVPVGLEGQRCHRVCFMPRERREGCPSRELLLGKGILGNGIADFSDVDQDREIRWFTDAFKNEIETLLASRSALAWTIRWGMVWWTG